MSKIKPDRATLILVLSAIERERREALAAADQLGVAKQWSKAVERLQASFGLSDAFHAVLNLGDDTKTLNDEALEILTREATP
jgi:hypothetical protein